MHGRRNKRLSQLCRVNSGRDGGNDIHVVIWPYPDLHCKCPCCKRPSIFLWHSCDRSYPTQFTAISRVSTTCITTVSRHPGQKSSAKPHAHEIHLRRPPTSCSLALTTTPPPNAHHAFSQYSSGCLTYCPFSHARSQLSWTDDPDTP